MKEKILLIISFFIMNSLSAQTNSLDFKIWNKETYKWFNEKNLRDTSSNIIKYPLPVVYNDTTLIYTVQEEFNFILNKRELYIDYVKQIFSNSKGKIFILELFPCQSEVEVEIYEDGNQVLKLSLNNLGQIKIKEPDYNYNISKNYNRWFNKNFLCNEKWEKGQQFDLVIATEIIRKEKEIKYKICKICL